MKCSSLLSTTSPPPHSLPLHVKSQQLSCSDPCKRLSRSDIDAVVGGGGGGGERGVYGGDDVVLRVQQHHGAFHS